VFYFPSHFYILFVLATEREEIYTFSIWLTLLYLAALISQDIAFYGRIHIFAFALSRSVFIAIFSFSDIVCNESRITADQRRPIRVRARRANMMKVIEFKEANLTGGRKGFVCKSH
jgi:hypothetical protein